MNKRGFSLIEMLAVLVVLGLIAAITLPNFGGVTKTTKQQLYDVQIKTIKESSKIFITDYMNKISLEEGESITFELKLLKDMDIINQDLKNPLTNKYFSDNSLITLTNQNDLYTTILSLEDSTEYLSSVKYKDHIVLFKGTAISDDSQTILEDNFIILNYDGKIYEKSNYKVIILNKVTINSTYSKIEYQINVMDDDVVTTYTLSRQENCQTGICDL